MRGQASRCDKGVVGHAFQFFRMQGERWHTPAKLLEHVCVVCLPTCYSDNTCACLPWSGRSCQSHVCCALLDLSGLLSLEVSLGKWRSMDVVHCVRGGRLLSCDLARRCSHHRTCLGRRVPYGQEMPSGPGQGALQNQSEALAQGLDSGLSCLWIQCWLWR